MRFVIDKECLTELLTYRMCNDHYEQSADLEKVDRLLNQLAMSVGYPDWVAAYHDLP